MNQNFHIYGLTTEYAVNPIDLFTPKPRFSWKFGAYPGFRQKAYRIAVASSREKAERGAYDLWDSGFVAGSRNVAVEYGGRELGSRQEGFWKCFAEDERGECAESEIASFEIALLSPEDWKGSWQSAPHHFPGCAQYWRCPFVLPEKKIRRARAYVCGLGYHELYLNGAKIGDNCIVGAGALVTGKMDAPAGSMILGSPAKVVRLLTEAEIESNRESAREYCHQADRYRED